MTDEAFLEALLAFMTSIPTADVWQVRQPAEGGPQKAGRQAARAAPVICRPCCRAQPRKPAARRHATRPPRRAQEPAWRKQQRRLLAAQFGPREVESLAVNAIVPVLGEEGGPDEAQPLEWVFEKETRNLDILHGQSDLSSW